MYTKDNPLVIESITEFAKHGLGKDEVAKMQEEGSIVFKGSAAGGGEPNGGTGGGEPGGGSDPNGGGTGGGEPGGGSDPNGGGTGGGELGGGADPNPLNWLRSQLGDDSVTPETILEQRKAARELQNRVQQLESLATTSVNPFANESIAKINAAVKEHGIDFQTASRIVDTEQLNNLSDEDALILNMRLSGSKKSDEVLRNAIRQQYGYEEDEDGKPSYKNDALMQIEAENARSKMTEISSKIEVGGDQTELQKQIQKEQQEKRDALLGSWNEDLRLMQLRPEKMKFQYGEGENDFVEMEVEPEFVEKQSDSLKQIIAQYNLENNEKGQQAIKAIIKNNYVTANLPKILTSVRSKVAEQIDQELHNPNPPRRGAQGGGGGQQRTNFEVLKEYQEREMKS
jgi:hypothetical protein